MFGFNENKDGELLINGLMTINDNIDKSKIICNGGASFKGTVTCETLIISGAAEFSKIVKVNELRCNGTATLLEDLEANVVEVNGVVNSQKEINSEKFRCNGIGNFNSICGESVRINSKDYLTSVNNISATTIFVKGVRINKVSGDYITIGLHSEIELIEYRKSLTIAKGAKIKKIIKL